MILQFKNLSDRALLVYVSEQISEVAHEQIQNFIEQLKQNPFKGLIEIVPGYTNLCIYYDPFLVHRYSTTKQNVTAAKQVQDYVQKIFTKSNNIIQQKSRIIEIPVIYGGEFGPDLENVAKLNQLTPEEVIQIHSSQDYLVYMLGFAPGFPFLGGLDRRIATPRHTTPRFEIAAGSVGIAGEQTGIYPLVTPGGWQIIGRTFAELFLPAENPPTLLRAGDRIRFIPVQEGLQC